MNDALPIRSAADAARCINMRAAQRIPFVFILSFRADENLVLSPEEASAQGIRMSFPGFRNHDSAARSIPDLQLRWQAVDLGQYKKAFERVQKEIHYGNTFLLNLTFPTPVSCNYGLKDIFDSSRARYKLIIPGRCVVFSPERFIRIEGRTVLTQPMKGTTDAGRTGAYAALAADPKEDAEHNTIVDLLRNDLGQIASQVRVRRFKYIEQIPGNLLQMSSEITGELPEDFRHTLGDRLFRLLPAGSICGAPKSKTLEIIRETEQYERGFYTGVFGYYDGAVLDSAVAIRFLEQDSGGLIFKSGGGITHMSEWTQEYAEYQKKIYVPLY